MIGNHPNPTNIIKQSSKNHNPRGLREFCKFAKICSVLEDFSFMISVVFVISFCIKDYPKKRLKENAKNCNSKAKKSLEI